MVSELQLSLILKQTHHLSQVWHLKDESPAFFFSYLFFVPASFCILLCYPMQYLHYRLLVIPLPSPCPMSSINSIEYAWPHHLLPSHQLPPTPCPAPLQHLSYCDMYVLRVWELIALVTECQSPNVPPMLVSLCLCGRNFGLCLLHAFYIPVYVVII